MAPFDRTSSPFVLQSVAAMFGLAGDASAAGLVLAMAPATRASPPRMVEARRTDRLSSMNEHLSRTIGESVGRATAKTERSQVGAVVPMLTAPHFKINNIQY